MHLALEMGYSSSDVLPNNFSLPYSEIRFFKGEGNPGVFFQGGGGWEEPNTLSCYKNYGIFENIHIFDKFFLFLL